MTSSKNLNETTENFLLALEKHVPQNNHQVVIKLTYDPITNYVNGWTFENTDLPFVEITREQYDQGFQYKRLKIIDGIPVEIKKVSKIDLGLVKGNRWFTDRSNMLIIGLDNGWDESITE